MEDERVVQLEAELDVFRQQLATEKDLRRSQRDEHNVLVEKLTALVETMSEAQVEIPIEPEIEVSLVPAVLVEDDIDAKKDSDAEARRLSRLKAQGEKFAEFVTNSGERYEELVISRVTDIGVVFRHKGGIARVPFADLPIAWRDRFYYDEDRALLALKHEHLAQVRYNRAADAQIAEMNAKKAEEELTLEKVAQAVAQVQQPATTTTIIEDRIQVYPPLIVNRDYDIDRGVYYPPVVRPPVVRTPQRGGATIRPSVTSPRVRPSSKPAVRPTPMKPSIQRPISRPTSSRPMKPSTQRPARPSSPMRPGRVAK